MRALGTLALAVGLWSAAAGESAEIDWSPYVGTWEGDIVAGGATLPTVFHFEVDDVDELIGTVDSPTQNAYGLPISSVTLDDDGNVRISISMTGATFVARLEDDRLVGTWKQRGIEVPLSCARRTIEPVERVAGQERFVGSWEGTLAVSGMKVRLLFHVAEEDDGRLTGTTDSPDQGARGIPISRISPEADGSVEIRVDAFGGTYTGRLTEDGDGLNGHLEQHGVSMPLDMKRADAPPELARPQTPVPPFPYRAEDVTFDNGDVTLAGTLTIPDGDGPFAGAVLITGSGAQDRDETLFEHKPFLVIADHLTRRGVAVLRVDDRGVGGSSLGRPGATSEELAGDVLAGVRLLRSRPEIDARRIGLIGHSEGGLIGPIAAVHAPEEIAFIVMLAGPGLPGDEILYMQGALIARAAGQSEEFIEANRATQARLFTLLRNAGDATDEELEAQMRAVFAEDPDLPEGEAGEELVRGQLRTLLSPWTRFFITFDPRPTLEKVRCPILALNGEKDVQVPPKENLAAIEAALKKGGNADVTVLELASLNHLFQTCDSGALSEYWEIEETFAPAALDTIADWITTRFASPERD